jgi:hypothetical protein
MAGIASPGAGSSIGVTGSMNIQAIAPRIHAPAHIIKQMFQACKVAGASGVAFE